MLVAEFTALECVSHSWESVIACFGEKNLRKTTEDFVKLLMRSDEQGFPEMIGGTNS